MLEIHNTVVRKYPRLYRPINLFMFRMYNMGLGKQALSSIPERLLHPVHTVGRSLTGLNGTECSGQLTGKEVHSELHPGLGGKAIKVQDRARSYHWQSRKCISYRYTKQHSLVPSIVVEWLTLLLRIREFTGSNLGSEFVYPD
jgi:hypothetical protein